MKTFLIITTLVIVQTAFGQIQSIDKVCSEIKQSQSTLKKVVQCEKPDATRYAYFDNNALKMVTIECQDKRFSEQPLDKKVTWYFDNDKLIYAETIWTDVSGKITYTDKIYLTNDHVVAYFKNGSAIDNGSDEFKSVDKGLFAYAQQLKSESVQK